MTNYITVTDDLTGEDIPAVEECPVCFAGPFAGETEAAAVANLTAHIAHCWTPQVGDTFTMNDDWPWHVGDQTGTHLIAARMRVTDVDDRQMRYERSAVLSQSGAPPLEQWKVWTGAEAGTTALAAVPMYVKDGRYADVARGA